MNNVRWVGKLCLVVAIALELGAIFINLREGESIFYLFNLANKFSLDNNLFIVYWGAIIGIIFVSPDLINKLENKGSDTETVIKDTVKQKRTDDDAEVWIESGKGDAYSYYVMLIFFLVPLGAIIGALINGESWHFLWGILGALVITMLIIQILKQLYKNHYLD